MNSDELAPIVLFVYNRLEHTKQTVEALQKNNLAAASELYIFSDAAKTSTQENKVQQVRNFIRTIKGFKQVHIIEQSLNKGLANSVISGVTEVINKFEKVIVLEDDIVTSQDFLEYMNEALGFYQDKKNIWSIAGFTFLEDKMKGYKEDVYLSYRASSWGWGTWKDRWETIDWEVGDYYKFKYSCIARSKFNRGGRDMSRMLDNQMEGKIDSWAIRWCYSQSKQNKLTICPVRSKVQNIGMDGTGIHCGKSNQYDVSIDNGRVQFKDCNINKEVIRMFKDNFGVGILKKIEKRIKKFMLLHRK